MPVKLSNREREALEALAESDVSASDVLPHDRTVIYRLASMGLVNVSFSLSQTGRKRLTNESKQGAKEC